MLRRVLIASIFTAALCAVSAGSATAATYDNDTVIVQYRSGITHVQRVALLDRVGAVKTVGGIGGLRSRVLQVEGDPATVARRLNASSNVAYAEPNFILRASATPNDARFGELYGMNNTGQTGGRADADIDAPEGWDAAGLGAFPAAGGVKVGLVDTGIQQNHEDLSGQIAGCAQSRGLGGILAGSIQVGSCADDNGHGTHTAGTIAAKANNGVGVAGVAFNSRLVICRALGGPLGTGSTADVANCINWTHQQGSKVISMSLGGGDSTTLHNAVQAAWAGGGAAGSVIVAAAGNDGDSTVNYPAGYAEAVSVAATDNADHRASFSNANADVEVAGPGVNVLSSYNDGGYRQLSGTSMATPHASGVTAVLWQLNASSTAAQIRTKLDAAVDDLGAAGRDTSFGFGRVNLCKAAGGSCSYTGGG
jgi:thermitase